MEAIDGMHKAGLAKYGYKYVVIDDGWQGERVPGRPQPNEVPGHESPVRLCQKKGFILGIYTTRGSLAMQVIPVPATMSSGRKQFSNGESAI